MTYQAATERAVLPVAPEPRRRWPVDAVLGVLAGVVVLLAGLSYLATRSESWAASATLLVLPVPQEDPNLEAGYYDTLSQGQVVGTYAEVVRVRATPAALSAAGLSPSLAKSAVVTVTPVPDTSVITVSAQAGDRRDAEAAADAAVRAATPFLTDLKAPYSATVLSPADGSGESRTTSPLILAGVVVVAAVVVAALIQQAVATLRQPRRPPPHPSPPGDRAGG